MAEPDLFAHVPIASQAPAMAPGQVDLFAHVPITNPVGLPEAIARGAASGTTFGFEPSLVGGAATVGLTEGLPVTGMDPWQVGRDITLSERKRQREARTQHPVAFTTGEVLGGAAVPLPGSGLMAAGRPLAARIGGGMLQGALAGGLTGAGEAETWGEMPGRAALGAGLGIAGGGVAGAVAPAFTHYVTAPIRALAQPGEQAARIVAEAYARARNLPVFDWMGRPTRFVPGQGNVPAEAVLADYLGKPGRTTARWAANVSPEAATGLENVVSTRMEQQGQRLRDFVEQRWGVSDNDMEQLALRADAARTNSPLYQHAMLVGNNLGYSPHLDALRQSPAVQEAMRGAAGSLQNRIIGQGGMGGPLRPADPNSLQYWDQVKRGLDSQIGRAERAGDRELVSELRPLKQRLVDTLDNLVPDYADARGNARLYFGHENAIEAGAHAINNQSLSWQAADRAWRAMNPQDRRLFEMAGRNEFVARTQNVADRFDLWKRIDQSENERNKLRLIFGDQGYRDLEAMHHAESIMSWLSNAVRGNSTTEAQRMAGELMTGGAFGLAGAGAGYTFGDVHGAVAGGSVTPLLGLLLKGARGKINMNVAEHVGQMLTGSDPAQLDRLLQAARRSDSVMQALRNMGNAAMARGAAIGAKEGGEAMLPPEGRP
jgi:hypothetical protein